MAKGKRSRKGRIILPKTEKTEENIKLWGLVEKTDPAYTKAVTGIGRKMTTADPYYQIKVATATLGMYGTDEFRIVDEDFNIIQIEKKVPFCLYTAVLEYIFEGKKGRVPVHSDMQLFFKSGGYDKDWAKKIATDALTKGLSKIGFNTDIFLGMFEDNKYVASLEKEFSKKEDSKPWDNCDNDCDNCKHYDECPN